MSQDQTPIPDSKREEPQQSYLQPDGSFDTQAFLDGLDAIFSAGKARDEAEPYLQQALVDAENAGNDAGLLTVLNEIMGFYRSQGRHQENMWMIQRAIELATRMRIEGSEAWTTTLINAATGLRAAKKYDQAEDLYRQALASAAKTLGSKDRRLAALHNNLSMLYSETDRPDQAEQELRQAMGILENSSTDPSQDQDLATTHTNLALLLMQRSDSPQALQEAWDQARTALDIYRTGHLENSAHYASALAGFAQVCYMTGRFSQSADTYRKALAIIEDRYGKGSDYYQITKANLGQAQAAADKNGDKDQSDQAKQAAPSQPKTGSNRHPARNQNNDNNQHDSRTDIQGLDLAKTYWEQVGRPMLEERYPQYRGRIAVGLMGHGSDCYGFDDAISRDHDFGPGFCLWLTSEDYQTIGDQLQKDYEALPTEFMGFGSRTDSVRAKGANRRVGVFEIGAFFESLTGYRQAPPEDHPHEWLLLDEATLAAATNGRIFADPLGQMLATRQGFKAMPDDVRFCLISRRLGMIAQAGQYNLPRSLQRGDEAAAMLSINEFIKACASLIFLINNPLTVGYLPYYKWTFAALRRLSGRVATRLADLTEQLEDILRLASAACYGGQGFGEGGKGARPAAERVTELVESICARIVEELQAEGLTNSPETFLEWQRPYVEAHISSDDTVLHSI
ncbi:MULTISPECIES: DUF4037 domain-containing protein [Bifidobacterium]|uniref:DUF4037 domain-containing protein n=1 Tax=Bifidobacterium apousia TaxID=2750996 RepID=A0A556R5W6_9BIFI|nr:MULTISPECIES: DUF4037 domain-containing protein [Bifidobacterium]MBI0071216.1 DUF4037 domain-containing protein [Bifidobacterium sp. W8112]MBI0124209.1 DUF4037 domain-containing protein [Bifidobacterium apousia]MBI0137046.1 DUF4037 domain-containing protein [Bifidobacterium sp. W8120]TSJ84289.1 DUF4037 domain-containing protein [Bifidobacterium apousia]